MNVPKINFSNPYFGQNKYTIREFSNGKEFSTVCDGEEFFHHYIIDEPKGILTDLEQCINDLKFEKKLRPVINFINESGKFINEKIYGIAGFGGLTSVFDIGNDRVLKISEENPFEYRKHNPKFDIPLLSQIEHYGNMYGYIQQKADTENVNIFDVQNVKRKMKKQGFTPSDDFSSWRIDQVGRLNGSSYLLDSRCAIPRNNRKTRFVQWFKKWFDRTPIVLHPIEEITDLPPVHVNEKPKPNYNKQEAIKIIKDVLSSWKESSIYQEKLLYTILKKIKII